MIEDDYILLSGIQHYVFCRRQWGLLYIDRLWEENIWTAEGRVIHEKAHDYSIKESRKNKFILRGLPLISHEYQIKGNCDIVEFYADENGIPLPDRHGKWTPFPVEYKRGKPKEDDCDRMQLLGQVLCLEEMLATSIHSGAIFYHETRRREVYTFTKEDRESLKRYLSEMRKFAVAQKLPKARENRKCRLCSMKELCLPKLTRIETPNAYIKRMIYL